MGFGFFLIFEPLLGRIGLTSFGGGNMSSKQEQHWAKTKSLTVTTLVVWAIFGILLSIGSAMLLIIASRAPILWQAWAHKWASLSWYFGLHQSRTKSMKEIWFCRELGG